MSLSVTMTLTVVIFFCESPLSSRCSLVSCSLAWSLLDRLNWSLFSRCSWFSCCLLARSIMAQLSLVPSPFSRGGRKGPGINTIRTKFKNFSPFYSRIKPWFTRLPAQCHASACWIWHQPGTKLRVLAREREQTQRRLYNAPISL